MVSLGVEVAPRLSPSMKQSIPSRDIWNDCPPQLLHSVPLKKLNPYKVQSIEYTF